MNDPAFPHVHDHRACMAGTLAAAEALTRARGEKLTPLRRRVLEIVLESHRPVGAYDVLASLARDRTRPAPPTVYRALEFLLRQGFVHRIDSLSAFVGCFAPEKAHRSRFFLCLRCGRAAEIEDASLDEALVAAAARAGFAAERETVELAGICGDCANTSSAGEVSG
jgi:Fur family transcriptional regulator, zinc uptake regulator